MHDVIAAQESYIQFMCMNGVYGRIIIISCDIANMSNNYTCAVFSSNWYLYYEFHVLHDHDDKFLPQINNTN